MNNAFLWATADYSCCLILRVFATSYSRTLHIWIAGNEGEVLADAYKDQVIGIAQANQCERITYESPRALDLAVDCSSKRNVFIIEVEPEE